MGKTLTQFYRNKMVMNSGIWNRQTVKDPLLLKEDRELPSPTFPTIGIQYKIKARIEHRQRVPFFLLLPHLGP